MQHLDDMKHEFEKYDSCSNIVSYLKATVKSGCLISRLRLIISQCIFLLESCLHSLIHFKTILFYENMDTLPPELIGNILRHLKKKRKLTPFALISRIWHEEVERINFSSLSIKNTELATFASIFEERADRPSRRTCLRNLRLTITRPDARIDNYFWALNDHEKAQERRYNNETFTTGIKTLFALLQSWRLRQSVALHLNVTWGDENKTTSYRDGDKVVLFEWGKETAHLTVRTIRTRLEFCSSQALPVLDCVESFDCCGGLSPGVFIHVVSALPGLRRLVWEMDEEDDNLNSLERIKARYGKKCSQRAL